MKNLMRLVSPAIAAMMLCCVQLKAEEVIFEKHFDHKEMAKATVAVGTGNAAVYVADLGHDLAGKVGLAVVKEVLQHGGSVTKGNYRLELQTLHHTAMVIRAPKWLGGYRKVIPAANTHKLRLVRL